MRRVLALVVVWVLATIVVNLFPAKQQKSWADNPPPFWTCWDCHKEMEKLPMTIHP